MTVAILKNVLRFMERVTLTGQEAYAFVEAHNHIAQEVVRLENPAPPPTPAPAAPAPVAPAPVLPA